MSEAGSIEAFRSHPREWERNLYVYPVLSRRARGLSVGINLSPHKACNMDCVYCQVDRTTPPRVRTVDVDVMERELRGLLERAVSGVLFREDPFVSAPADLHRLADIAFSGDGEPTSFRGFLDASRRVVAAKEAAGCAELPVRILTNGIDLNREEVVRALALLDDHGLEVWAKLDAGTQPFFDRVARTATTLDRILANVTACSRLRPVVIQALFFRMGGHPPPEPEIDAWLGRLRTVLDDSGRISLVQVYTVARRPAEDVVSPLDPTELERIAERVRGELGLPAEVY
jgi:wyosine [tRNA(Phe)-imidazoG37] synthetase (radical SAM superfamily)